LARTFAQGAAAGVQQNQQRPVALLMDTPTHNLREYMDELQLVRKPRPQLLQKAKRGVMKKPQQTKPLKKPPQTRRSMKRKQKQSSPPRALAPMMLSGQMLTEMGARFTMIS
jgi:hypothetical protein